MELSNKSNFLSLHIKGEPPFSLDLTKASLARKLASRGGRDPLYRALGKEWLKARRDPEGSAWCVIDANFGFGGDALRFAHWGLRVLGLEEIAETASLFHDAAKRAISSGHLVPELGRIELLHRKAEDWFRANEAGSVLQERLGSFPKERLLVYLDPMFPDLKSTAASRRELKYLSLLARPANPAAEAGLFAAAVQFRPRRIIVKRPKKWKSTFAKVAAAYLGKSHRFDVYTPGISY